MDTKESEPRENRVFFHFHYPALYRATDIVMVGMDVVKDEPVSVKLEECTAIKVEELNITDDVLDTENNKSLITIDAQCSGQAAISAASADAVGGGVLVVKQEPPEEIFDGSDNTEGSTSSASAAASGETATANSSDAERFGRNYARGDQGKTVINRNKRLEKAVCTICGKSCVTRARHAIHMRVHTGERPYKCNNCSKTFKSAENRNAHWLGVHSGERNFRCEICDKSYSYKSALTSHLATHGLERRHECSHCGKGFAFPGALEIHMSCHTEQRLHTCDVCGSSFKHVRYLFAHKKRHGAERPHKCPICDKAFRLRPDLKRHMTTHIGTTHTEIGPLECDICGSPFKTATLLRRHKTSHMRLEAFHKCDICDGQYATKRTLQIHKKSHTDENRFHCGCGMSFSSNKKLEKHRLRKCKHPMKG